MIFCNGVVCENSCQSRSMEVKAAIEVRMMREGVVRGVERRRGVCTCESIFEWICDCWGGEGVGR